MAPVARPDYLSSAPRIHTMGGEGLWYTPQRPLHMRQMHIIKNSKET